MASEDEPDAAAERLDKLKEAYALTVKDDVETLLASMRAGLENLGDKAKCMNIDELKAHLRKLPDQLVELHGMAISRSKILNMVKGPRMESQKQLFTRLIAVLSAALEYHTSGNAVDIAPEEAALPAQIHLSQMSQGDNK